VAQAPNSRAIQDIAVRCGVKKVRYPFRNDNCVLCGRCVRVCTEVWKARAIGFVGRGKERHVEHPFGVRPEDLHIAGGSDPAPYVIDAVVDVVEPLGAEILLDVKVGPNSLVARVEPTVRLKVHDSVRLAVNSERLHFFDMTSEKAKFTLSGISPYLRS